MCKILIAAVVTMGLCSCSKKPFARSAALPDNVRSDKPIVLKEGQAVILMKEGDRDLKVAASVVDGKLSVGEIDQNGRNFGVTWDDSETWKTTTEYTENEKRFWVTDKTMDGIADLKVESTTLGKNGFESKGQTWSEIIPSQKSAQPEAK